MECPALAAPSCAGSVMSLTACKPVAGAERAQGHERPRANEATRGRIRAEIAPAQNRCEQTRPVRVAAPELGYHGHALILGEEALLWCERVPPDLDLQRRMGADVADPVGVLAPCRADDCLTGARVVSQNHDNGWSCACRYCAPRGPAAGTCCPVASPTPGDTSAVAAGRRPGRDGLAAAEGPGAAAICGRLDATRPCFPPSSPRPAQTDELSHPAKAWPGTRNQGRRSCEDSPKGTGSMSRRCK